MFSKRIEEARTIAIGGHVRPDGDCTGSCMGMYNYLRENYPEKTVDVYLEEIRRLISSFREQKDSTRDSKKYELRPVFVSGLWRSGTIGLFSASL